MPFQTKENSMDSAFNVGDIIVPNDRQSVEDMRREILSVGDTFYTLKFLTGKQLVVKWPIHGVDRDHKLWEILSGFGCYS